jgi:phosphoribosylformylglycinamidine cyclo-ligase
MPPVFNWLQNSGNIAMNEMYRTFNCGIGMVVCVGKDDVAKTIALLEAEGEVVTQIGEIVAQSEKEPKVVIG